jgi:hypothetical protein
VVVGVGRVAMVLRCWLSQAGQLLNQLCRQVTDPTRCVSKHNRRQ